MRHNLRFRSVHFTLTHSTLFRLPVPKPALDPSHCRCWLATHPPTHSSNLIWSPQAGHTHTRTFFQPDLDPSGWPHTHISILSFPSRRRSLWVPGRPKSSFLCCFPGWREAGVQMAAARLSSRICKKAAAKPPSTEFEAAQHHSDHCAQTPAPMGRCADEQRSL